MRVLVQTEGSSGDVPPFVSVGRALAGRGHDVTVLGSEVFAAVVDSAGLGFAPSSDEESYRRTVLNPDLWDPAKGTAVAAESVVKNLRSTVGLIESNLDEDTVLVCSTLGFASRVVSERIGTPLVVGIWRR